MGVGANMRTFHAVPIKCWYQSFRSGGLRDHAWHCSPPRFAALRVLDLAWWDPTHPSSGRGLEVVDTGGPPLGRIRKMKDMAWNSYTNLVMLMFLLSKWDSKDFSFFSWERSSKILGTILKITWFSAEFPMSLHFRLVFLSFLSRWSIRF